MNLIIRIVAMLVFILGIGCLLIENSKISDTYPWINDYWMNPLPWYGVGFVIISVLLFLNAFILRVVKSMVIYVIILLVLSGLTSVAGSIGPHLYLTIAYPYYYDYRGIEGALKTLSNIETSWREQDPDRNGIHDYWTYDVSCLNRMYRLDGTAKVGFIDITFAKADGRPASDGIFGADLPIQTWNGIITPISKYGYGYQAMLWDEDEKPYNQNPIGERKIKATNSTKFAFVAYPADYGTSGVRTFIVNESGTIYALDCGGEANKVVLRWPGKDPAKVKRPDGRFWSIAE